MGAVAAPGEQWEAELYQANVIEVEVFGSDR